MAAAGYACDVTAPARVERFVCGPPDDTRASLRAHSRPPVAEAGPRVRRGANVWWRTVTVLPLHGPTAYGREESEPVLAASPTLPELIANVRGAGEVREEAHGWYSW